jgi:AcrR family transcriptional regulator
MTRDQLQQFVARGMSVREIAEEAGLAQSTVRHHLRRHGLRTARAVAATLRREEDVCPTHGAATFALRPDGYRRCTRCRSEAVIRRRRKVKEILVAEAGGACRLCGYATYVGALQFHHRDPELKRFALSRAGISMSLAAARAEVAKCILVCANCHAEVEAGIATIPEAASVLGAGDDPE